MKIQNMDTSPLHMTIEYNEKLTNMRFARTHFLSNLSVAFLKDYRFEEAGDEIKTNVQGKQYELDT